MINILVIRKKEHWNILIWLLYLIYKTQRGKVKEECQRSPKHSSHFLFFPETKTFVKLALEKEVH